MFVLLLGLHGGNVALATGLPNPDQLLKHGLLVLRLVKHLHRHTAKSLAVSIAIRLLCMQGNADGLPLT